MKFAELPGQSQCILCGATLPVCAYCGARHAPSCCAHIVLMNNPYAPPELRVSISHYLVTNTRHVAMTQHSRKEQG